MKRRNVALIVLALVLGLYVAYPKAERKEHACDIEELAKQVLDNAELVNFDALSSDCLSGLAFKILEKLAEIRVGLKFYAEHNNDEDMRHLLDQINQEVQSAYNSAINEVIMVEAPSLAPFNEKERRIHLKQIMSYLKIYEKYRNVPQRDVP